MDHLGLAAVLDGHSRGGQAGSVQIAFVAQRVVLCGNDDGGRQGGNTDGRAPVLGSRPPGTARDYSLPKLLISASSDSLSSRGASPLLSLVLWT